MKIKISFIISIVTLLIPFLFFYISSSNNLPFSLTDQNDFLTTFDWKEISLSDSLSIFKGQKDSLIMRITIKKDLDLNQADNYINDKMALINSLFIDISSPYPGSLSNLISCPQEFKPYKMIYNSSQFYFLYASERFTYGICSLDLLTYKSIIFSLYCKKERNLYFIELFIPLDEDFMKYVYYLDLIRCV